MTSILKTRAGRTVGVAMLLATLAAPHANAQADALKTLDRRAAAPLIEMGRVTKALCDKKNESACAINARLRRAAIGMVAAQQSCAAGSVRACQLFELGVLELSRAYRRFETAARGSGGAQLPADPLAGELFGENGVFGKLN